MVQAAKSFAAQEHFIQNSHAVSKTTQVFQNVTYNGNI